MLKIDARINDVVDSLEDHKSYFAGVLEQLGDYVRSGDQTVSLRDVRFTIGRSGEGKRPNYMFTTGEGQNPVYRNGNGHTPIRSDIDEPNGWSKRSVSLIELAAAMTR